jgi:hypothetical protein
MKKLPLPMKDLMERRQDQLDIMNDAKHEIRGIEYEVKRVLIKEGQVDFLSVNWTKMNKLHRGW